MGLVLVNQVLGALLGTGEVADRLHGALPALVAGGVVAVVGALLASLSTAATAGWSRRWSGPPTSGI